MVVVVRSPRQAIVGRKVIGKHKIGGQHMFLDEAVECIFLHVSNDEGSNAALALYQSNDRRLGFWNAAQSLGARPHIHLIDFNGLLTATKFRSALSFIEHRTNLPEHAPC